MTLSQKEYYDLMRDETSSVNELIDFNEGSLLDIIYGAASVAMNELSVSVIEKFLKTYFGSAEGEDLEFLATDHFGPDFARPEASKSTGEVTFSRPNIAAGDVFIPAGTIVKTEKSFDGTEISFSTVLDVTMTGLSVNASIEAVEAGSGSNVQIGQVVVIESALTDPSLLVTNDAATAGGAETPDDAEYYQFIIDKIQSLAGATEAAIEGAARSINGVAIAKSTTVEKRVIEWDDLAGDVKSGASPESIPEPVLYVADSNGSASDELIESVISEIAGVRAAGVDVKVLAATPISFDYIASVTLNASGPSYSTLSEDLTMLLDSMRYYVTTILNIGDGFNKQAAIEYMMSVYGPTGTDDITAFSISVPSGNVSVSVNEKLVPNNVEIV